MACTGNGATLTNGGTWTGKITRIGGFGLTREAIPNSDLSTVEYATNCQGDLITIEPLDVDLLWDAADGKLPPIGDPPTDWTIVRPDGSTIIGEAFVTSSVSSELANNELQEGSMQLTYTGANIDITVPNP